MRISNSSDVAPVSSITPVAANTASQRFSVLNDFRYLTESDASVLHAATGESLDRGEPSSQFAQQLALDRRTGELAPHQHVTGVYLRNAAARIEDLNVGRRGFTNPYSGEAMTKALDFLESIGRGRADIRL